MVKTLIWLSRILSSITTAVIGYGLIFRMTHGFLPRHFDTMPILMTIIVVIGLAGIILSWKKIVISGTLFIVNSLVIGIVIGSLADNGPWNTNLTVWSMLGLPFLVSGVLELLSQQSARKRATCCFSEDHLP